MAVFAIAQGCDWAVGKLWPPGVKIVSVEQQGGGGGNYAVTIENPTDTSMVVTEAIFRAVPPPKYEQMNDIKLMVPAVTYELPFDCSPGTQHAKLNPPFKITAKDVGAVVFRSTLKMHRCRVFVSLVTNHGQTKEREGISLGEWRVRSP